MEARYQQRRAEVVPAGAEFDPAAEIAKLVAQGKISRSESDRIQGDFESNRMTAEQVRDYVRQKMR